MSNATTFGQQAATYANARPGYPDALYDWIADNSPARALVWDVGTGSGQAAHALAERFDAVHATDMSAEMIGEAKAHPSITYAVADGRESGLPDGSVDAVCVATAVHWFADAAFWAEVARTLKPGGLFCAWTYQLPESEAEVQRTFLDPVLTRIDPYWAAGNRICMAGYSADNLHCPLPVIGTPTFSDMRDWPAEQLAGFARSWSAHFRAREDGHEAALAALEEAFLSTHDGWTVPVTLPISVLACRVA